MTGPNRIPILVALSLLASYSAFAAARVRRTRAPIPAQVQLRSWTDISGRRYDGSEIAGHKATVFLFFSTQCPISNQYIPRIVDLAKTFAQQDAKFFLVNSNPADTTDVLARYVSERSIPLTVIKDDGSSLADRLQARVTPEAIVTDSSAVVRYRGRIDDNVIGDRAIRHDLRDALESVLAGKLVERPRVPGTGCTIFRDKLQAQRPATDNVPVTYSGQVARILNDRCVTCHRVGDVAPFPLQTYGQASQWSAQIKEYTQRRIMPPWKAVAGFGGPFDECPSLTDTEVRTLASWADGGAPEGPAMSLPAPPQFPSPQAWILGTPDLVLRPAKPYHLAPEGEDVYRNFVLPYVFREGRNVSAIEFKPDNRRIVHHIVAFVDSTGAAATLDGREAEPGYSASPTDILTLFPHWIDVWIPGSAPRRLPPGVAFHIPAGARLIMQVHYHKSGGPEADRSTVALHFMNGLAKCVPHVLPVGVIQFRLQPGIARQELRGEMTIPEDSHLLSVFPHMHLLGTEMKVTGILPDGQVKPIIWVRDWDFNWQATYHFRTPIALPKGTRMRVVGVFDNSASNAHQLFDPPRMVRFGIQSTDEMCFAFLKVTLDNERHARSNAGVGQTRHYRTNTHVPCIDKVVISKARNSSRMRRMSTG